MRKEDQVALDDPLISPTYGRLEKLAPAYIVAARHDVSDDEAWRFMRIKLRQQGLSALSGNMKIRRTALSI